MKTENEYGSSLDDDDIYAAVDDQTNRWTDQFQGRLMHVIGDDYGKPLAAMHNFVREIITGKLPLYEPGEDSRGRPIYRETALSGHFRKLNSYMEARRAGCAYSPEITLFNEAVDELQLHHERFSVPGRWSFRPDKKNAELANELVDLIRKRGNTPAFKKAVASKRERATDNFRSAMRHADAIFRHRSRVEVLRIDFFYNAIAGKDVTVQEAKKDFFRLLRNRRANKTLFGGMLGYIWKLEYGGYGRGFHFHTVFFYDGAEIYQDAHRADLMGNYWVDLTQARGQFHNCNRDKRKYKHLGIGRIHRDEMDKRLNLARALQYLTKKDYCFRPEMSAGRVFGTGADPAPNLTGVGRPVSSTKRNRAT